MGYWNDPVAHGIVQEALGSSSLRPRLSVPMTPLYSPVNGGFLFAGRVGEELSEVWW